MDETGFELNDMRGATICRKGRKQVAISVNPNREHITLCIAVNAAGGHLEPFFVFKGLRRTPALREVLDDSQYALTESGYVNKAAWQDWVHYFLSNIPVKEDRNWILLILDGFGCHGNNPDLLEELYEEKVLVVAIPAHTSDVLQPLDVANFGPVKILFRRKSSESQKMIPGAHLTKQTFPKFIRKPLELALEPKKVISGFKKAGIWPPDKELYLKLSENYKTFENPELKKKEKAGYLIRSARGPSN